MTQDALDHLRVFGNVVVTVRPTQAIGWLRGVQGVKAIDLLLDHALR